MKGILNKVSIKFFRSLTIIILNMKGIPKQGFYKILSLIGCFQRLKNIFKKTHDEQTS